MKLFCLSNPRAQRGDFEKCVVAADSEEVARLIHPDPSCQWKEGVWIDFSVNDEYEDERWVSPDKVSVEYLGEAKEGVAQGVIGASI